MFSDENPSAFNARIEALTQALEASADAGTRTCARELVHLVLDFHRAGLQRIVNIIGNESQGLGRRLAADPVVASVLALHDLLPAAGPAGGTTSRADTAQAPLVQISRPAAPVSNSAIRAHGDNASVCERCGTPLADSHHHYVDVTTRQLSCSCRACWLLQAAHPGRGSCRPVPDRYLAGPALRLSSAQWEALQVPVNVAFFMFNSIAGR